MCSWHWLAVARTLCSKLVSFTQLQWCQSRLPIHSSLVAVWFGSYLVKVSVHNLNPVHLISCTCSLCLRDIDTMIWHCGKYKTIGEIAYWLKLSHVIKASFWPSSALWRWMPFDRPKAGLIDSVWSFNLHKIEQRITDIVGCQIFHHFSSASIIWVSFIIFPHFPTLKAQNCWSEPCERSFVLRPPQRLPNGTTSSKQLWLEILKFCRRYISRMESSWRIRRIQISKIIEDYAEDYAVYVCAWLLVQILVYYISSAWPFPNLFELHPNYDEIAENA